MEHLIVKLVGIKHLGPTTITKKEAEQIITALEQAERMRELIDWLNSECPEGTEETFDLSHDFTQNLRVRIERVTQPKVLQGEKGMK